MDENFSFGYWLRRQRLARDMRQDDLAAQLGVATVTLRKIESDARRPSLQLIARIAEAFGLDEQGRATLQRVARADLSPAALALPEQPAEPPEAREPHYALPTAPNVLIGREGELAELGALLRGPEVRLLTLLGPGGTGKTRLALQLAHELGDAFADGVCFVDLTPVRDPALVVPAIGRALSLQEAPGQPMAAVVAIFLREKALLLVLDNCEQVVDAAPELAALLAGAPRLRLLATSREALRIAAEQLYLVAPLAVPALDDQGLSAPAAQLFLARARAGRGDFAVTGATGAEVAAICRRLDGLPLALELAAARLRHLTPRALHERLERPLDVLTGGARDLPTRQQTLRATIAWSYELLGEDEQALFRRLGVFVGGWDLEAAEAVSGLGPVTLDLLGSLIDKSLVRLTTGVGDAPRYTMLETIREYALEQLAASGEAEATRERHAAYYLARVERLDLRGPNHDAGLQYRSAEYDNLRVVLTHYELRGDHGGLARVCIALQLFWFVRGYAVEGLRWAERAVAEGRDTLLEQPLLWAKLLCVAGMLHNAQSSFERAEALLNEALACADAIGDPTTRADILDGLGYSAWWIGDYARAKAYWADALALDRALNDAYRTGWIASSLAYAYDIAGDLTMAWAFAEEATTIFRSIGVRRMLGNVLNDLAYFTLEAGDHPQAVLLLNESITIAREAGDRDTLAAALKNMGEMMLERGSAAQALPFLTESSALYEQIGDRRRSLPTLIDLAEAYRILGNMGMAADLLRKQLTLCGELGSHHGSSYGLRAAGRLLAQSGKPEWAATLLGADEAVREHHAIPLWQSERASYDQDVAALRSNLSADAFAATWAAGRALTVEAATAEALAWLAAAQRQVVWPGADEPDGVPETGQHPDKDAL